jgi:hypothetical protein
MIKSFLAILTIPLLVLAIDAVSPKSLCDRFATKGEQKKCQAKIDRMELDSYLASVCEKQFSDEGFWSCLELGKSLSFDPKVMDPCFGTDLSDTQRLECLHGIASQKTSEFQRLPASSSK